MKVVIVEDEQLSAERIITLLTELNPNIEVLDTLDSVKSAIKWFKENKNPDLVFMDIQLGDGLSFDIFDQIKIDYPVIFITAYQEYAIKAFKVNSVDYLLKPVTKEDLSTAIDKYKNIFSEKLEFPQLEKEILLNIRQMISKPYKSRFMIKVGERIKSLDINDILYFYSMEKGSWIHTSENRNYSIDYTLDSLMDILDPHVFFRINRRYIIRFEAIKEMISFSAGKLMIVLNDSEDQDIYISRDRLGDFKKWLDK